MINRKWKCRPDLLVVWVWLSSCMLGVESSCSTCSMLVQQMSGAILLHLVFAC